MSFPKGVILLCLKDDSIGAINLVIEGLQSREKYKPRSKNKNKKSESFDGKASAVMDRNTYQHTFFYFTRKITTRIYIFFYQQIW